MTTDPTPEMNTGRLFPGMDEQLRQADPQAPEPDNPAAYALARHIADHPVSTIQAAFRYLNAPLTVDLHEAVSSAVAQSAPAETALRDRIAEALSDARRPGLGSMTEADAVAHMADAVMAVLRGLTLRELEQLHRPNTPPSRPEPRRMAVEEAYRLALSIALRLGTGATWEAIRDRAEDLTTEVEQLNEASRRLLEQRQEMAAERFAWQERGDRAEARVRQLEAAASDDRATVLNEAAGTIAADAALRETEGEYALAEYGYELARLIRPKDLRRLAVEAQQQTEPACPDPIECSHEAALGQAQQEIRRLGLMVGEYGHGASALSEKLQEARATNRRLNLRAQKLESELAAYRKAVADWKISDTSTYVPLRTLAAIAKAAGVTVPGGWELHYERVERLEAAEVEVEQMRERHKASLRRADKVNNELMEEVQRYAIGAERPVLWSVYNRMHSRAAHAEAALGRVGRIARRLAAHAAGFKDVLDASDHGPWGTTVGADIAELIEALSDQPSAPPAVSSVGQAAHTTRSAALERVVQRIGQMADAWEQQLPEVIRTPAVVSAIRAALEPVAELPAPTDVAACNCDAEVHIGAGFYHQPQCATKLRRMADETQPAEARCGCPHPVDEHSVYGCADGCGCEWMPKRKPMDPVHILGIKADDETPQAAPCGPAPDECDAEAGELCAVHEREEAHAEGEHCFCGSECDKACTCGSAGDAFVPIGHYADCPQVTEPAPAVPQCDGCGHLVHRARKCPAVRYGERCECDEPAAVSQPGKEH